MRYADKFRYILRILWRDGEVSTPNEKISDDPGCFVIIAMVLPMVGWGIVGIISLFYPTVVVETRWEQFELVGSHPYKGARYIDLVLVRSRQLFPNNYSHLSEDKNVLGNKFDIEVHVMKDSSGNLSWKLNTKDLK